MFSCRHGCQGTPLLRVENWRTVLRPQEGYLPAALAKMSWRYPLCQPNMPGVNLQLKMAVVKDPKDVNSTDKVAQVKLIGRRGHHQLHPH